jgi:hypothetical protein
MADEKLPPNRVPEIDMPPPQSRRGISLTPFEGERILRELRKIEVKVGERLDDHEEDIKELRQAVQGCTLNTQALNQLSTEVRIVLAQNVEMVGRDIDHEKRLGSLEKMASDAGKSAGGKWGAGMGALGSAIVAIIIAIAQALK